MDLKQSSSYSLGKYEIAIQRCVAEEGGGLYPLWRARIAIVGSDRSGKTSTVRSIKGEKFDPVSDSTNGLEMTEADAGIRVLEVDFHDVNTAFDGDDEQKEPCKPWRDAKGKGYNAKQQSIAAHVRNKGAISNKAEEEIQKENLGRFQDIIIQKKTVKPSHTADDEETKRPTMPEVFTTTTPVPSSNPRHGKSKKEKKGAEPDVIEQKGDLEINIGEGDKIRLTIWDNGGLTIFRTIQNLYIVRNSSYIVVFNLEDFLGDEERKKQALDHLHFWLYSIKHHGVCSDENKNLKDPSILYPPVILVGTHLDSVQKYAKKEKGRFLHILGTKNYVKKKLLDINKILIDEFGSTGIFSSVGSRKHDESTLSPGAICIKGREFLYNETQELCFWPIDNHNQLDIAEEKSNIPKLRSIITKSIMEDHLHYIDTPVPTTWLQAIDSLSDIASKFPILPLYNNKNVRDNTESISVVSVLRKAGALNNASDATSRAMMFMRYCHQVGLFVYFDAVPGLQDHCILNPQWLIDRITCVIRDIKLHRLPSDRFAMELDGGKLWEELRDNGVLGLELIQEFWNDIGEDTFDFLIKLMIKLNIFGRFTREVDDIKKTKFIVPSLRTSPFHAVDSMNSNNLFSPKEKIEQYFGISSGEWSKLCQWSFSFEDFLPVGCYNQLIASLVDDWRKGYSASMSPQLLPSAALLCMGPIHQFALVVDIQLSYCYENERNTSSSQSSSIKIISRNEDEMKAIFHHIKCSLDAIIKNFYKGTLKWKLIDAKGLEMKKKVTM